jgi:hypothetical protein
MPHDVTIAFTNWWCHNISAVHKLPARKAKLLFILIWYSSKWPQFNQCLTLNSICWVVQCFKTFICSDTRLAPLRVPCSNPDPGTLYEIHPSCMSFGWNVKLAVLMKPELYSWAHHWKVTHTQIYGVNNIHEQVLNQNEDSISFLPIIPFFITTIIKHAVSIKII